MEYTASGLSIRSGKGCGFIGRYAESNEMSQITTFQSHGSRWFMSSCAASRVDIANYNNRSFRVFRRRSTEADMDEWAVFSRGEKFR